MQWCLHYGALGFPLDICWQLDFCESLVWHDVLVRHPDYDWFQQGTVAMESW